jgi:hypothetical protein
MTCGSQAGLPPKADIRQRIEHVCLVPVADLVVSATSPELKQMQLNRPRVPVHAFTEGPASGVSEHLEFFYLDVNRSPLAMALA